MSERPIVVRHVDHFFGEGELRRQVLFDVCAEIDAGEIVILTGPSGSGKTTLLTLIGALRSPQSGSLRVLGAELREADEEQLAGVRRRIGYVFQAHNLLESLTARQNVRMSLELEQRLGDAEIDRRVEAALDAVGLAERGSAHPAELSGGQRQRVAIARALARQPLIVLADEPTASLDRETGRGIVELLQRLAREKVVTVVLVTHDSRILDVADRVLTLEDGRIRSLLSSVEGGARRMLDLLGRDIRRGELVARVDALDAAAFGELLREVTDETRRLLDLVDLVQGETFESMLDQVVRAFTRKAAELLGAEAAALRFADESGELTATGVEPATQSATVGSADDRLTLPVNDSQGRRIGVVEVSGPRDRARFGESDERRLRELTASLGLILESWWRMSCACRAAGGERTCPCCGESWRAPARSPGSETDSVIR